MPTLRHLAFLLLAAVAACYGDPFVNIVTNGGFETGDFSGWTLSGTVTPCDFVGTSADVRCIPTTAFGGNTGAYAAELGNAGGNATLSQTLSTTGPGTYDVSFWLASQNYGTPLNDFSVNWGGTTLMSSVNMAAFGYTRYDFSGLTAAGSTTVLSFTFRNDPSFFALDDVSVVDPISEPAAWPCLGLLLPALLFRAPQRRRKLQFAHIRR